MEKPQPEPKQSQKESANQQVPAEPQFDAKTYSELRFRYAGIALAEIVKWQVAERKAGQEDVAATWAFRYADRMMTQAVKRPSRASVNVRGVPGVTEEPMIEVQ